MTFLKKGNLETMSIIDYQAFKYYRENSKLKGKGNISNYVEHGKIISRFYEKVGEKIVESPGGVFIEGIGYFSGIVDMLKSYTAYFKGSINLNRNTSGYKFFLIFIPIAKDNTLREWVADGSFMIKVKSKFSKFLKEGIKYKFNPSYFINKFSNKNMKND